MQNRLVWLGLFLLACSEGERDDSSTIFGSGGFTFTADGGADMSTESSASGGQEDTTSTSSESGATDTATDTDDTATTNDTNTTDTATDTDDTTATDTNTTDTDTATDTNNDTNDPLCGNGQIDQGEDCDGGNLGGQSCVDLGFDGGVLACDPTICVFDTSGCMDMPSNECDNNCNGCACPSFECTMCCALKDKVDVCGGGMCGCF
jgi:hypothetical protein